MKCVHGVRIGKPCPDCEYEETCRQRGVKPENRWEDHPLYPGRENPLDRIPTDKEDVF